MKRLIIFFKLDIFRVIGLGIFLSIFFLVSKMEQFGEFAHWPAIFFGKVFIVSLVLSFPLRFLWFKIFTKQTDDITLEYKKFVEETKVKKWL